LALLGGILVSDKQSDYGELLMRNNSFKPTLLRNTVSTPNSSFKADGFAAA
jgi:hypothetical protein